MSVLGQDPTGDPLPSWRNGTTKQSIVEFVERTTRPDSPEFVAPDERISVFDNDGTLYPEQPMYVQLAFALDRVRSLAPQHPEWAEQEPFASLLAGDTRTALAGGMQTIAEIVMATHAGTTTDEFHSIVSDWIGSAKHPLTDRLYTEMVYVPMLELLDYLRAHEFRTFIASAGGVEFMRPWTEKTYGIPPEQVIGSSIKTVFAGDEGRHALLRLPELDFMGDGAAKPVGINRHIGRRPIAAFGNSDGDLEMLQWATTGPGARLALIVHHTDAEREWAYDHESSFGRLDKALAYASDRSWTVADMKRDWATVFSFQIEQTPVE